MPTPSKEQRQFDALPFLLRRREVLWLDAASLRVLVEEEVIRTVQAVAGGAGRHGTAFYYVKASLAPVLKLQMDWSGFEDLHQWPVLLRWSHLLAAGLREQDIPRLVQSGQLTVRAGHGYGRFHRTALAALIGYGVAARTTEGGLLGTMTEATP